MADFPIIPEKTGVLFFDTLNLYLHPEIPLEPWISRDKRGYPNPANRAAIEASGVIPRMQRLNQACREAGIAVIYGQADHRPDYKDYWPHVVDRSGNPSDPGPGPLQIPAATGTSIGAEVIAEIAPQPGDYVMKKHRYSAFFQTHLELSLRTAGIDTLLFAGGGVGAGIASTVYAARDIGYNLVLVREVITGGAEDVAFWLDNVFPSFARVMTLDETLAALKKGA